MWMGGINRHAEYVEVRTYVLGACAQDAKFKIQRLFDRNVSDHSAREKNSIFFFFFFLIDVAS